MLGTSWVPPTKTPFFPVLRSMQDKDIRVVMDIRGNYLIVKRITPQKAR